MAESSIICKAPRVSFEKWFLGRPEPIRVELGPSYNIWNNAYTYDPACVGPCLLGLNCDGDPFPTPDCKGAPDGDYRHPINALRKSLLGFEEQHVLRILGNFTLYRGTTQVTVGNKTHNQVLNVAELAYMGDIVKVTVGGMYDCLVLDELMPPPPENTVEQYINCIMPPGVGRGHTFEVIIRNATYKALLDGCTMDMRKESYKLRSSIVIDKGKGWWPPTHLLKQNNTGMVIAFFPINPKISTHRSYLILV